MEEKNASSAISDDEFLIMLKAAKQKKPDAMLQIVELFREDIEKVSQTIRIPHDDAVSEIVVELLEFVQLDKF